MSLEAGVRLRPYAIDSRLIAGDMGEVYLASDTRLDRSVAIKILLAELQLTRSCVRASSARKGRAHS